MMVVFGIKYNDKMTRWVKLMGVWYQAEECEDSKIGLYCLIAGHICPLGELDEVGNYINDTT